MRGNVWAAIVLANLLAACGGNNSAPVVDSPGGGSALEVAAIESGAIQNASAIDPAGLYQRDHDAGRDALCLMRADGREYAFGMDVVFGEGQYCHGRGSAKRAGDKMILHFNRYACIVVTQYEGDRLVLPGAVDMRCDSLCTGRGSLAGIALPRISSDSAVSRRARDHDGNTLCSAD